MYILFIYLYIYFFIYFLYLVSVHFYEKKFLPTNKEKIPHHDEGRTGFYILLLKTKH